MKFLWEQYVAPPGFPAPEGGQETDVPVVGGGMTGILCALNLQEADANDLLVEGKRVGKVRAALLLKANLRAVEQLRTRWEHERVRAKFGAHGGLLDHSAMWDSHVE